MDLILVTELQKKKNNVPFTFHGECLIETPFSLGHFKNGSRLKVSLCGNCNSRLSFVKLTYLFSLKTKCYSAEASRWTQSSLSQTQSDPQPRWVSNLDAVQLWLVSGPSIKKILKVRQLLTQKLGSQDLRGTYP